MLKVKMSSAKDGIKIYRDAGLLVGYSGIETGNVGMRYGTRKVVIANRNKLRRVMGDGSYVLEYVKQSIKINDLGGRPQQNNSFYECDGLFTTRPDVILEVVVADCIGMVIYDVNASVLGLVHIGRHGAGKNFQLKALDYIMGHYRVPLGDVRIFLPPSIRQPSYYFDELPEELKTKEWTKFIQNGHVDLPGRVVHDLLAAGLNPEQISQDTTDVGDVNTPYFSHYLQKRELGPPGRNAIAARLPRKD